MIAIGPNLVNASSYRNVAAVIASDFLVATAIGQQVNISVQTNTYLLPNFDSGRGPT